MQVPSPTAASLAARLAAVLPRRWAGAGVPVLGSLLAGFGAPWAWLFTSLAYVAASMRLQGAQADWLDAMAGDYLGARLPRRTGETDASYAARAGAEILRPRVTRPALAAYLTQLAGNPPRIFEPTRPADTGGYTLGGVGYGVAGGYGDLSLPNQFFVTLKRPLGATLPNYPGYGAGGGYGVAEGYGDIALASGGETDAELYAAISETVAAGYTAWTQLT